MEIKPFIEYWWDNVFEAQDFLSCAVSKAVPTPSSLACGSHCCLNFLLFFVVTDDQIIRWWQIILELSWVVVGKIVQG